MKILAIHSALHKDIDYQSQVDHWRIYRPMRELSKHVNWTIDHVPGVIPKFKKNRNLPEFTEEEMQEGLATISAYDIVFTSYHPDPTTYLLLQLARDKYGVQFIMDVDDDMFAIHPGNPYWLKANHDQVYQMQRMIAHNPWICTPSPELAIRFNERRPEYGPETITIIPNFIPDDYQHPGFDNGDKKVIGFMGGSSHYFDLHDTKALDAVQQAMHEDKSLHFRSIGMFTDTYLPKARNQFDLGVRGTNFISETFPSMNFDVGLAPLVDDTFNAGKSNIKWQEYTRAGIPTVASPVGPYANLKDGETAILVKEDTIAGWYSAIKLLLDDPELRAKIVKNAQAELAKKWRLEDNWMVYKTMFEVVNKEGKKANADHRAKQALSVSQTK
jgi:glycosyltransferase involved in cell wall biosynthesis